MHPKAFFVNKLRPYKKKLPTYFSENMARENSQIWFLSFIFGYKNMN